MDKNNSAEVRLISRLAKPIKALARLIKKYINILLIIIAVLLIAFGIYTVAYLFNMGITFKTIFDGGLLNFLSRILGPMNIIWGVLLICLYNSKRWHGVVFLILNSLMILGITNVWGFDWPLLFGVIIPVLYACGKIIKFKSAPKSGKGTVYIICIILAILSILPFVIMIINSTRSSPEIQQHGMSLIFSSHLLENWGVLSGKDFNPLVGFQNSLIISTCATFLAIYFSTLTAYALFAYNWKMRQPFFTLIMAVMMIPGQITAIGFYQFMYQIHMTNNLLALILPAIAAPMTVFFMRQYMLSSLNLDIVASARIDGANEFRIFNGIVLPIMKPAMATQAIFTFVFNWNNLFIPMILLTNKDVRTMPIMVSLLKGDAYKTKFGVVYLALTLSVLPLFIVYFALSRYIISGVALGSIKE